MQILHIVPLSAWEPVVSKNDDIMYCVFVFVCVFMFMFMRGGAGGGGHSTEMTPENPLWVGAWWIGFLAGGAAALLVAVPILGYPRQLPG